MAITINGSGTITGVSAGGLPDGSVTADDLASTLDLGSKTLTIPTDTTGLPAGTVVKVTYLEYSGRQTLVASGGSVITTMGTFTKDSSTSTIYLIGDMIGSGSSATAVGVYVSIDDSAPANDDISFYHSYHYEAHGSDYSYNNPLLKPYHFHSRRTGISTGSHTVRIGWKHPNNSSSRPFGVVNPTRTSDVGDIQNARTHITVFEIEE